MNLVEPKPRLGLKTPFYEGLKLETQLSTNLLPNPLNPPIVFFILDDPISLHIKFLYLHGLKRLNS